MEQRVSLITLGVSDLALSRGFYRRLGWQQAVTRAEGVAFFQTGGLGLALYPREYLARDAEIAIPGPGSGAVMLAHNTRTRDEVDAILAEAEAAGASILKRGHDVFWGGYVGYFADPDGFVWEVAWNPSFAMNEDGSIRLPA